MKASVGERGQVTIPKRLRERLGIRPGQRLEFVEQADGFVARKAAGDDPLASVRGILDLGMSTDEFIDLVRGPAELPTDPSGDGR